MEAQPNLRAKRITLGIPRQMHNESKKQEALSSQQTTRTKVDKNWARTGQREKEEKFP